ncbi:MAG: ribonuclease III [Candidatus Poribacteria bacterium]|nr:ribonuclease III [Candidatus Poribacteria bacterium]
MPHPIETALGYGFQDKTLLETALRHRSASSETDGDSTSPDEPPLPDNERLEFLGDAVIDLAIRVELFHRHPSASEGDLTRWRAYLASRGTFASIGRRLGLEPHIRHDLPPTNGHPSQEERMLANTVEALFGAIYCDAGYETARKLAVRALEPEIAAMDTDPYFGNYKNALQTAWQQLASKPPEYRVVETTGLTHAPHFEVAAMLGVAEGCRGSGWSKREASQNAARETFTRFTSDDEWRADILQQNGIPLESTPNDAEGA